MVAIDPANPARDLWQTVIPEGEDAIAPTETSVTLVDHQLIVRALHDAHSRVVSDGLDDAGDRSDGRYLRVLGQESSHYCSPVTLTAISSQLLIQSTTQWTALAVCCVAPSTPASAGGGHFPQMRCEPTPMSPNYLFDKRQDRLAPRRF